MKYNKPIKRKPESGKTIRLQQKKRRFIIALAGIGLFFSADLFCQEPELFSKIRDNDIKAVKELIKPGTDINLIIDDMMGYTALELAQDTLMMKVLINAGADINLRNSRTGYTPLMMAILNGKPEEAGFLLRQGADFRIKANDGTTALILACGVSEELSRLLLEKGANIRAITDKGQGVFTQCAIRGLRRETVSYEFAEFLLSQGADINETNTTEYYGGYTPLLWAVHYNDANLVSFLVNHGANVNAKSNKGKTPLSMASEAGFTDIEEILKAAGAVHFGEDK
ncbi:ankyrin repeat domain-containing protein [Lentimicrobium sp.]|jgi:ankyrin repeat protein|uniref:ankyrin repeat domain-containing protein n=1 Tax=Lentimicrobium sp. TaxID=2034841 RepID=UPI002CAB859B|nr:ankyrin repeat domain-containing protein [Lentimicrobium sp.]HPF65587.1 ankyrin repeat domain-containing protein [Lentimicrobium sp.]